MQHPTERVDESRMVHPVVELGSWERAAELAARLSVCWPGGRGDAGLEGTLQVLLEGVLAGVALGSSGLVDRSFAWTKVRLAAIGRDPGQLVAMAADLVELLVGDLGEAARPQVVALLRDVRVFLQYVPPDPPGLAAGTMAEGQPGAGLLTAMLAGDRIAARGLLTEPDDVSVVLDERLEPAMRALGALWQTGRVDPAQEHIASRLAFDLVQELSWRAGSERPAAPGIAFVRCAGDEHTFGQLCLQLHCRSFGLRLLPLPPIESPAELPALLDAVAPAALAFGCATPRHLVAVRSLVRSVRTEPRFARIPMLIGGAAFADVPQLAVQLGATAPAVTGRRVAQQLAAWLAADRPC